MRFWGTFLGLALSLFISCQAETRPSAAQSNPPNGVVQSPSAPAVPVATSSDPSSSTTAPATAQTTTPAPVVPVTPAELGLTAPASTYSSSVNVAPPTPPTNHLFDWSTIKPQVDYGLAIHLRNYNLTEDQWNQAVAGYQTQAISMIATRKYATPELLQALREVPRPFFAYNYQTNQQKTAIVEDYNTIIDLGYGATMSAPSIQAFMTAQLHPTKEMTALEIGTGSGTQAVLLSRLVKQVYTIEVRQALAERVSKLIKTMGYTNIETKIGDGYYGWKEKAPFDIIIVTCQASHIPPALVEQLKPNGVMVIPVGPAWSQNQQMLKVWKDAATGKIVSQRILAKTSFIPMLGANQSQN